MPFFPMLAVFLASQSTDDYSKSWDTIATDIRRHYYARSTRKAEMDRLLDKYRPLATSAHSHEEFAKDVNDMIGEFHDSHFAFYPDSDQGYYTMDSLVRGDRAQKLPNIGAYFRSTPDGWSVQMVLEGSVAEKAGLRKNDIVRSADGEPFQPVGSFAGRSKVDLGVRRGSTEAHFSVKPSQDTALDMFLEGTQNSIRTLDIDGRKIGYIHVWTLTNEAFKQALAGAVENRLAHTDGFILDLRDGFGGRPEGFADPFFRPEMAIDWKFPNFTNHENFGYQRPLVVLINGGSRSAKEVLSLILKKSRRATLVGSRTAGNVLGTWPSRVNDWSYLEIPMVDVVTDGMRIEGHGVDPNVEVAQEFDPSGKDLYIQKALDILKSASVRVQSATEGKVTSQPERG